MSQPPYTMDDLESDINHLRHLLDVVVWNQQEMHHDGNQEQHQVDALTWIARDMVDALCKRVEAGIKRRGE
jgi:hypothetical protein